MQRARGSMARCRHGGSHVVTSPLHRGSLALSRRRRGATRKGRVCIRWELQNDVLLARAGSGEERGQGRGREGLPRLDPLSPTISSTALALVAAPGTSWLELGRTRPSSDCDGHGDAQPGARLPGQAAFGPRTGKSSSQRCQDFNISSRPGWWPMRLCKSTPQVEYPG